MTLSEAIRLGAMLKPQAFGRTFDGVGTCALGAVYDAIGRLQASDFHYEQLKREFPLLGDMVGQACPACHVVATANGMLAHLNDSHKWTREAVADHIATIEAQQDQPASPVQVTT